jgi:hypothetical protein
MIMGRRTIRASSSKTGEALERIGRPLARRIASAVQRRPVCCRLRETEMAALLQQERGRFPHRWEELRGMSARMGLDIEEVFLWHCLQNQLDAAASSSVVINRLGYRLILNKRELRPPLAGSTG